MTSEQTARRRRYSKEMKSQVLAECEAPDASVAKVAMSHGINANVVHGWRKLARGGGEASVVEPREFVPVVLEEAAVPGSAERGIEVEVRRGAVTMKLTWPRSAAADFAAWTRELLRCSRRRSPFRTPHCRPVSTGSALSQIEAAAITGTTQPKVSQVRRYKLQNISLETRTSPAFLGSWSTG